MPGKPQVSILFPNQDPDAAAVLGRAFVDDLLIKAILPPIADATERGRRMGVLFAAAIQELADIPWRRAHPCAGQRGRGRRGETSTRGGRRAFAQSSRRAASLSQRSGG